MPCDSDYLSPTAKERELRQTAILLRYLLEQLKLEVPEWIITQSTDVYASREDLVPLLCDRMKALDDNEIERIVYNAHDKLSRDLADWWERHKEADERR